MKKTALAILACSLSIGTFANSDPLASSQNVLSSATQTIQQQSKVCYESLVSGDFKVGEKVCNELQGKLTTEENSIEQLKAQMVVSIYLSVTNKTEDAARDLRKALKSFTLESLDADTVRAEAYNVLGNIYTKRKEMKNAGEAIVNAIELADKIGNKSAVLENLSSLTSLQAAKGDKVRALDYAKRTVEYGSRLNTGELNNSDQVLFTIHRTLAMAYAANKMYVEALASALKAEEYAKVAFAGAEKSNPLVGIKSDIAAIYTANGQFSEAIPYAEETMKVMGDQSIPLTTEIALSFVNLIQTYVLAERYEEAEAKADQHAHRLYSLPDVAEKVRVLGATGVFYMKNTKKKDVAKKLITTAAITSSKVFGDDAATTVELAEMSESPELDRE